MNGADRNRTIVSVLLLHDAKIVLSMLVEILGFNDFTASRRILRHRCVPFVVVAGILSRVAPVTGRSYAWRPLVRRAMTLRPRAVIGPI